MKKKFFLLAMLLTTVVTVSARQRNYIYLFDCTQSMQDYGVWDNALRSLDNTLSTRSAEDDSRVTILPFQDNVLTTIGFDAADYNDIIRQSLRDTLNSRISQRHRFTNIIDALNKSDAVLNTAADNRIYLFTDGEDSHVKAEGVAQALEKWCGTHPNTKLFYIMLHKAAENDRILDVANYCDDIHTVKVPAGEAIPVFADLDGSIHSGILDLDRPLKIGFSENTRVPVKVTCDNPMFDVEAVDGHSVNGTISVRITSRRELTEIRETLGSTLEYEFRFRVESTDPNVHIINPTVDAVIANKVLRVVDILDADFNTTDIKPGADWYDSFLFWSADTPDTLTVDLAPQFNQGAEIDRTKARLAIVPGEGQNADYRVLFNGEPCPDGTFTVTPGSPAELGIVFNPGAGEGKRYLSIVPADKSSFDVLNGKPVDAVTDGVPLKTTYHESMNPLKWIFIIAGIAILALLILWFAVIRPLKYPTIKIKKLVFNAPYKQVTVKGARKVILTSRNKRQNPLNRVFTGKIVYFVNPAWTTDLTFNPSKKGLRFAGTNGWNVTPTSSIERHNQYTLNSPDGEKYPFQVN